MMGYPPIIDYPVNRDRLIAAFTKVTQDPNYDKSIARGKQALERPKRKKSK